MFQFISYLLQFVAESKLVAFPWYVIVRRDDEGITYMT